MLKGDLNTSKTVVWMWRQVIMKHKVELYTLLESFVKKKNCFKLRSTVFAFDRTKNSFKMFNVADVETALK